LVNKSGECKEEAAAPADVFNIAHDQFQAFQVGHLSQYCRDFIYIDAISGDDETLKCWLQALFKLIISGKIPMF